MCNCLLGRHYTLLEALELLAVDTAVIAWLSNMHAGVWLQP